MSKNSVAGTTTSFKNFFDASHSGRETAAHFTLTLISYVNQLSQTLFGKPVEQGIPNTCAEAKMCLILFYSGSRSSLL